MNAVIAAADDIEAALKTVPEIRVYRDPGSDITPPGVVIGPPRLQFEGIDHEPSGAVFPLYLVEKNDARTLERLLKLVPKVTAAIDEHLPDAAVTAADPGTFNAGGVQLPTYEITTEVSL